MLDQLYYALYYSPAMQIIDLLESLPSPHLIENPRNGSDK